MDKMLFMIGVLLDRGVLTHIFSCARLISFKANSLKEISLAQLNI